MCNYSLSAHDVRVPCICPCNLELACQRESESGSELACGEPWGRDCNLRCSSRQLRVHRFYVLSRPALSEAIVVRCHLQLVVCGCGGERRVVCKFLLQQLSLGPIRHVHTRRHPSGCCSTIAFCMLSPN